MAKKQPQPINSFSEDHLEKIAKGLINWLREKEENFHIDEYLFVINNYFKIDIEHFRKKSEKFNVLMDQADTIELAKLKKFAAADRLNATIVKQILINKHGWL